MCVDMFVLKYVYETVDCVSGEICSMYMEHLLHCYSPLLKEKYRSAQSGCEQTMNWKMMLLCLFS